METAKAHADTLLDFFKALADANRLKLVGLLAQGEYTVEELAAMLDVRPSTVSHHLAKLSVVGLVSARAEGYYNVYTLETETLHNMAETVFSSESLSTVAADVDLDAYDRKIVNDYMGDDGRLVQLPSQRKKVKAVLRYIIQAFEPGREYTEGEVNEVLERYHDDTSSLRRELIDMKMLTRDRRGTTYRMVDAQ